jgi:error-prone DNA polymerase
VESLARRANLPSRALRLLADGDALASVAGDRRAALWDVRRTPSDELPLFAAAQAAELGAEADMALPDMPAAEHVVLDYQTHRLSLKDHPLTFLRDVLHSEGVLSAAEIDRAKSGQRVRAAGVVLVRQRPGKGNAIFVTLEDETGIVNVLIWARIFETQRRAVMASRMMEVEGVIQRSEEGVVHLMGQRVRDRNDLLDNLTVHARGGADVLKVPRQAQPQSPDPRGYHPRDVRVLPRSRDFH